MLTFQEESVTEAPIQYCFGRHVIPKTCIIVAFCLDIVSLQAHLLSSAAPDLWPQSKHSLFRS